MSEQKRRGRGADGDLSSAGALALVCCGNYENVRHLKGTSARSARAASVRHVPNKIVRAARADFAFGIAPDSQFVQAFSAVAVGSAKGGGC